MEWYEVKDKIGDLYSSMSDIWTGNTEGCPFTAGKKFITSAVSILDVYFIGREYQIHSIYEAIRNDTYAFNKINIIDLPVAYAKYMEYYDGMKNFANASVSLHDDDEVDASIAVQNVNTIIKRDGDFVDGIFYSEDDEVMSINDAMKNVEMISDLMEFEKTALEDIDTLNSNWDSPSQKYKLIQDRGIELYMNSVCSFIMDMIMKIVYTYHCVTQSMVTKAGSDFVQREEDPEYKLF